MTTRLVIEATGFGLRGAVLARDQLVEIIDIDLADAPVTEAFFLARVTAVDARLDAAFVDIGQGRDALLLAKDARPAMAAAERQPIARLLQEGQRLIVQGQREPADGKGARVTTDVKLFGFHLILRPQAGARATDPARGAERQALQERGDRLFPGRPVALRKLADGAEDAVLTAELTNLERHWQRLTQEAAGAKVPARIGGGDPPLERILRAVAGPELASLEIAAPELQARARSLLAGPLASLPIELVRLDPNQAAFEQTGVQAALEEALERAVTLPGGGGLTIERTTACIAIDVDSAGRPALDVDLEAAAALARLLRLRNLGGTIIVDFVDLGTKAQQQRLDAALRRAFRDDPVPVTIYPMSPLGIVQISRARRGRSLDDVLRRPCPTCAGTGTLNSLRAAAEALIQAVRRAAPPPAAVRVAPDLAQHLGAAASEAWQTACPGVRLTADRHLPPGGFELG